MSPILPPKEEGSEPVQRSIYLPRSLWERLSAIADETKREDPAGRGYSRNEVIIRFLEWAAEEHEKERRPTKKK